MLTVQRERLLREAAYFDGLAVDTQREGKPERADYYRECAAGFRAELQRQ